MDRKLRYLGRSFGIWDALCPHAVGLEVHGESLWGSLSLSGSVVFPLSEAPLAFSTLTEL
jgi:hypothetical protein